MNRPFSHIMFNKISSRNLSLASAACVAVTFGALTLWHAGSSEVQAESKANGPSETRQLAGHERPGVPTSPESLARTRRSIKAALLAPPQQEAANPGFGRQIAGTWIEPGDGFSTAMNIRADGTMTWWGSWFFGDGTGDFFNGIVLGTWKKTGQREITTIELGHLNNGDGSFFASGRVQEVFTFDPEFESFTYEGIEDLFAPDQDPTDPDAEPFFSFGFAGGPINRLNHMN
jgi:hypothetical protein